MTQSSCQEWLHDLRSCLVACLQDTDTANKVGWQHTVYRGTYFSAALEGDLDLMKALYNRPKGQETIGKSPKKEDEQSDEVRSSGIMGLEGCTISLVTN